MVFTKQIIEFKHQQGNNNIQSKNILAYLML